MKDRGNGLAVIVPIGPGRTAAVALKSLLQAPDIRELVVVLDGGSVDPVVREFEARVPTRIVESRGQGAPAARNSGASVVGDCDILWFLDDDDAALPAAPERIQAAMVSMPHCGAWAFPAALKSRGGASAIASGRCAECDWDTLARRNVLGGCSSVAIRRESFRAVGGFDPALVSMQDWDLYLRLLRHGPIGRFPGALVVYDDLGGDRISASPAKKRAGLASLLAKHRHAFDARTVAFHETRILYLDCLLGSAGWPALLSAPHRAAGAYYLINYLRQRLARRRTSPKGARP